MRAFLFIGLAGITAALFVAAARANQQQSEQGESVAPSWFDAPGWPVLPDPFAAITGLIGTTEPESEDMTEAAQNQNVQAFLMMIRTAEGTADANGYRRLVGGGEFDSFADHPRQVKSGTFRNGKAWRSTAAGAYQFLAGTWDECKRALSLPDFSPASQDAAAVYLIQRRGALDHVRAGRFDKAISLVAKEWASLPGSPYGQPTITMQTARALIESNGGAYA